MNNETTGNTALPLVEPCEGECKEPSAHTPQTEQTGEETIVAPDAEAQTAKEREERFHELMDGEYKDLFTAYFQETFNRRFKEYKTIQGELERARALSAAVEERFGTREHEELLAAIRAEKLTTASAETAGGSLAPTGTSGTTLDQRLEAACAKARRELLDSIRARGMRPAEGVLEAALTEMAGAGRLTRAEREELARRAARGERITL